MAVPTVTVAMIGGLVADLISEASAVNERRLLVLAGGRAAGRDALEQVLSTLDVDPAEIPLVSDRDGLGLDRVAPEHATRLLGTTHPALVIDAHAGLSPNAVGRVVGAVDGGGLLVLVCPSLDAWPRQRDHADERLAVPPFEVSAVTGRFRQRFVQTLREHPGIAIIDVDAGEVLRDGLTDPAPRVVHPEIVLPPDASFPMAAYEACLTQDQVDALQSFEQLHSGPSAVVLEADRGRGKSSVVGLAAACLALEGELVTITAPGYRSAQEGFERAAELLNQVNAFDHDPDDNPRELSLASGGRITYHPPAAVDPTDPDVLFVDEAAAIGVPLLGSYLAAPRVAFTTTIHGYEGTGRGFAVRFKDQLTDSEHTLTERSLASPIRYAAGDPIEVWAFRALLLDAAPAADQLVAEATPETVTYRTVDGADLLDDEPLLRELFGLLVLAHYQTEPDDLARLFDAPNIQVRTLEESGHVAAVALLAREGDLPVSLRARMYEGGRVRGNMLPDVLTSQLRDEGAGKSVGLRVMRIATHPAIRRRGLGSALLTRIHEEFQTDVDWFGVGFGATPDLVSFWAQNGYGTVHLSTTRNDVSGEHSALMLRPVSREGIALHRRHADWFANRVPSMLSGPLRDVETDIVRVTLRATDVTLTPDLSDRGWRLVAATAFGPGLVDVDLRPFRALVTAHLVDPTDPDLLSARQERLLVRKVLQGWSWRECTSSLGFHSAGECMRALGAAFVPLVEAADSAVANAEADRYRSTN